MSVNNISAQLSAEIKRECLALLRLGKYKTYKQIAEYLEIDKDALSNIINGNRNLNCSTADKIFDKLGKTIKLEKTDAPYIYCVKDFNLFTHPQYPELKIYVSGDYVILLHFLTRDPEVIVINNSILGKKIFKNEVLYNSIGDLLAQVVKHINDGDYAI